MSPAGTMRVTAPRWNSMGAQSAMPRVQSSYTNGTVSGYPQQMYAQTVPTMNPRNRVATGQGQIAGVRQQTTSGSSSTQSARPITGQIMQTRLSGTIMPVGMQQQQQQQQRPPMSTNTQATMVMGQQQPQQQNQQRYGQTMVKYNPNTRNMPSQQAQYPQHMVQTHGQHSIIVQGQEPLTTTMLATANPQEQKQMLGERMFPLIQRLNNELAGKITGMLLEMDNSELLMMLENSELLKSKVDEAVAVLQAHQKPEIKVAGQ